jgi:hypothetical protein
MSLSGQSTGALVGTVIGAVTGAVLAVPTFGISVYAGIALGAAGEAVPPVPRHPCADGTLARLVNGVLGLPWQLGSRDPANGSLDCGGLMLSLLAQGRDLAFPCAVHRTPLLTPPLIQVWQQRGHHPTRWRKNVQPWDVVVWHDAEAERAVNWDVETAGPLAHCGLVVSPDVLVSATIDLGVGLFALDRIAAHYGPNVLTVLRPPAPERSRDGRL